MAIVEDSVLRTEMAGLKSQEEDAPKSIRFFKPMSWLGQIRPHRRDEAWSASLWQTFFAMTMGAQIPVIAEKPLAARGCRKFQLDALEVPARCSPKLGDHLCTCTAHSGAKKSHDVELAAYLANAAGPVPLVLDLRIAHDRFGSRSDLNLNGHLHYPNDIDKSLNETAADKIRKYRADYNNNPPAAIAFMPAIASTSRRLHSAFVRLLFLQAHRETDSFLAASGVQLAQTNSGQFHFRRAAFSSQLKARVGLALAKAAALRITLNLDRAPIKSKSHTHPSHSQTSRLLTSSLSSGVRVPRTTQCM